MKTALIIVNKHWECDAVMAALLNYELFRFKLGLPIELNHPRNRDLNIEPKVRAQYNLNGWQVEVWCVSDFLEGLPLSHQSSSQQKAIHLSDWINLQRPTFVIAVGTAGYPSMAHNINGSVIVGTNVFVHDGHPNNENPNSSLSLPLFGKVVASSISAERFAELTDYDEARLLSSMVKPPNNPATPMILANYDNLSLGTVNVTDYSEYAKKDSETLQAYKALNMNHPATSIETTHGLLRLLCGDCFVFISGITDRLGHFDDEVTFGQNFAAAFNAGIVLTGLIANL